MRPTLALVLLALLAAVACDGPSTPEGASVAASRAPTPSPPPGGGRAGTPDPRPTDRPGPASSGSEPPSSAADPSLFAYDPTVPLSPRVVRSRDTRHARIDQLTFAAADGQRVPALFSRPLTARDPTACILLGHGLRGDKESFRLWDLLAQAGFSSLAIDARAHGERRDPVTLERLATEPRVLERLLRETVVDMRRAIDYLATRSECDPARTGYLGASMGGFLGTMLAGVDERVQAPVLLVSGADWPTMLGSTEAQLFLRGATPQDIREAGALLDPIDPKHWAPLISPRPVLMIAGDADLAVPPAAARALHEAAQEPKTIIWYEGGHALPSGAETERIFGRIALWLVEHLGG